MGSNELSFTDSLLNEVHNPAKSFQSKAERIDALEKRLREFLTFDQAIQSLAAYIVFSEEVKATFARLKLESERQVQQTSDEVDSFFEHHEKVADIAESYIDAVIQVHESASSRGKKAADARFNMLGGARDKRAAIRAVWATGKFQSRDICAEQEGAGIGMSPSTARKALIGTPNPTLGVWAANGSTGKK